MEQEKNGRVGKWETCYKKLSSGHNTAMNSLFLWSSTRDLRTTGHVIMARKEAHETLKDY